MSNWITRTLSPSYFSRRTRVAFTSFPEIVTYGKDKREALVMAEDAIRLVLEDCAARGEPIPAGEPLAHT